MLSINGGYAQKNKKAIEKQMEAADELFDYGDYKTALTAYRDIYQLDSNNRDLNYKIGVCIYNLRENKKRALKYFERGASVKNPESYYYLGNLYHLNLNFEEAINAYNEYKKIRIEKAYPDVEIDRLITCSMNAREMMKDPQKISIANMGPGINSKYPDYVPLISADESIMIFTSRRESSTGKLLDPYGNYFEDVYISYKKDGSWTDPQGISNNINTKGHDACVALAPDGEQLFIYRTDETLMAGDLFISKFDGKDWTVPEKQGPDINLDGSIEASASLSADRETLYVSSDRPGGFGGRDLYRIVRLPNGEWSKALNLGSTINTRYDEDAPFIHPDGKTLYFSSKGHKNMGGYDVFKSTLTEAGWLPPVNMAAPINTVDEDIYFVLSVNGKTGYYSSNRENSFGSTDIYSIKMPTEDSDLAVISGFVFESGTEEGPVSAKITLMEESVPEVKGVYKTNALTGKYILIVDPSLQYKILIEAEGYKSHTQSINSSDNKIVTQLEKNTTGSR